MVRPNVSATFRYNCADCPSVKTNYSTTTMPHHSVGSMFGLPCPQTPASQRLALAGRQTTKRSKTTPTYTNRTVHAQDVTPSHPPTTGPHYTQHLGYSPPCTLR
eukprot:NODE_5967_length_379_cov_38.836364_g5254_i0.p1 GENE.NODE_5967_length_379_cov_38.836364_g5254_i0~~NODE_5967_length_379_cov_38.836364_g5254_i0.p1  ORF type:complete len:104 (-),score=24.46 NODE_5967_length_379_cov_38.836364_g5254_i0:9-320(-)